MGKQEKHRTEKVASAGLAHLRHPLVFYGLALLVTETAFGGALALREHTAGLTVFMVSTMALLFTVSIAAVTFLTYVKPRNIMLQPQDRMFSSCDQSCVYKDRLAVAKQIVQKVINDPPQNPSHLHLWLTFLDLILGDLSELKQE